AQFRLAILRVSRAVFTSPRSDCRAFLSLADGSHFIIYLENQNPSVCLVLRCVFQLLYEPDWVFRSFRSAGVLLCGLGGLLRLFGPWKAFGSPLSALYTFGDGRQDWEATNQLATLLQKARRKFQTLETGRVAFLEYDRLVRALRGATLETAVFSCEAAEQGGRTLAAARKISIGKRLGVQRLVALSTLRRGVDLSIRNWGHFSDLRCELRRWLDPNLVSSVVKSFSRNGVSAETKR
ncbi:hypothetical protein C8R45DRAFT_1075396, partial [Mycena sanguinolenta]